ncbi:MarR family transcriptional regulator [Methylobacterium organophilum]|nr:MarR family transcriptional regulator [Methylobacterium organophilum]
MDEVPVAGSAAGAAEAEAAAAGAADARHWPLAERPGFLARRMHQIHVSLFAERCAAFRVTPLQYSLLSLLRDLEEADQTTLASAVALDRTTTTGALKRLAARGLVSRTTSPLDRRADMPLYVHFGQLWGLPESGANGEDADTIVERVIPLLRPGDVLAHPFTRHPGGFINEQGEVHHIIRRAMEAGLKVDVGHGSHFSYRVARASLPAGVIPYTLGADMHGYNTEIPEVKKPAGTPDEHHDDENHPFLGQARFSLTQAMSSMMALGIPLEDVVPMVTSHPAEMLRMSDRIGALKVGYAADVSVLHDDRGRFLLRDNEDTRVIADRLLRPAFCLRAGKRFEADSPILPQAIAA